MAAGQIIALSGSGSTIGFLGAASNTAGGGAQNLSGTAYVTYTDGSVDEITITFSNWINKGPVDNVSEFLVATCTQGGWTGVNTKSDTNKAPNGDDPGSGRPDRTPSLFLLVASIDATKTLAAIQLPAGSSAVSTAANLHIFAIATS